MSDRRSRHYQYHQTRPTFEEKYRALENEIKRKNDSIDSLKNDFIDTSQHQHDLSRSSIDQSVDRHNALFSLSVSSKYKYFLFYL